LTVNKASRAHATRSRDNIDGNGRERNEEYDEMGSTNTVRSRRHREADATTSGRLGTTFAPTRDGRDRNDG
jgi:hypothetical protein